MMPFRLTRQFLNLMQPMHETDLIHSIMVHSLRAYRADPDLLLNTMDVFVKEPSLDWKVCHKTALASPGLEISNVSQCPLKIISGLVLFWTQGRVGK